MAWLADHETELAINPIILGELRYSILSLPKGKRRSGLLQWLDSGVRYIAMLDLDTETADHWAQLLADFKTKGRAMSVKGSLIAAIARQFSLPIATRNTKDFAFAKVKVVNPFSISWPLSKFGKVFRSTSRFGVSHGSRV